MHRLILSTTLFFCFPPHANNLYEIIGNSCQGFIYREPAYFIHRYLFKIQHEKEISNFSINVIYEGDSFPWHLTDIRNKNILYSKVASSPYGDNISNAIHYVIRAIFNNTPASRASFSEVEEFSLTVNGITIEKKSFDNYLKH
jgi:hypothetical protein